MSTTSLIPCVAAKAGVVVVVSATKAARSTRSVILKRLSIGIIPFEKAEEAVGAPRKSTASSASPECSPEGASMKTPVLARRV
jgi:hypothetical protein